jgi:hypothetical protein
MNEITTLYGDICIENVPAWGNAKDILIQKGYNISRSVYQPNYKKDWCTGLEKDVGSPFVYFLNQEGVEVAYWSSIFHHLFILKTPRIWGTEILNEAKEKV